MKKELSEKLSVFAVLTGIVAFIWVLILFLKESEIDFFSVINPEKFAQFGDFIGGVIGSIWALAGVVLFYLALKEQRKDFATNREVLNAQTDALKQQIREFELQREELSETREVFKIQSETIKKQQFESTFFNLVNLHHGIVNSIDLRSKENRYGVIEAMKMKLERGKRNEQIIEVTTGRDCFVKFCKGFRNEYKKLRRDIPELSDLDIAKQAYKNYYKLHQSDLGHYFRNLYHIFKFIKNSEEKEKKRYTSLVRAQLSNDELFLLFYNGISEYGSKKFLPLIEEFHILKNLSRKEFINKNKHSEFYEKSAYGE